MMTWLDPASIMNGILPDPTGRQYQLTRLADALGKYSTQVDRREQLKEAFTRALVAFQVSFEKVLMLTDANLVTNLRILYPDGDLAVQLPLDYRIGFLLVTCGSLALGV